jgi:hypothetical protein
MFNEIIKFCKQAVLNKFGLEEAPLVDGTVEEALEADIPKEVGAVLLSKEVLLEVTSEVT